MTGVIVRAGCAALAALAATVAGLAVAAADEPPRTEAPAADEPAAVEPALAVEVVTDPDAITAADLALAATIDESIEIDDVWMGTDLIDARATTRAVTSRAARPVAGTAVVGDLLAGVPGVAVQRTGPGQGAPMIRGLIGSAVLVLVDGMRVNNAIFRPAPNQYLALIDPWAIERIDVIRGPGSTLFGSDAMGGVVNVVTPLPAFADEHWTRRGAAALALASADRSVTTRAAAATGRRGSGLAVGVTWQRHGDLRAGGGERMAPSAYSALAVDATGHLERGRHATTAWLRFLTQPELPRTDELRAGFGQDAPGALDWRYLPNQRAAVHLRHLIRRPLAAVRGAEVHVAWQRVDDGRRFRGAEDAATTTETNRDDSLGIAARGAAGVGGGELTAGTEYWLDRVGSSRRETAGEASTVVTARFPDGAVQHQAAVYGLWRRALGERVVAQGGVRATLAALRAPAADRGVGAAVTALDWAAEGGIVVTIAGDAQLVGNLGRGFRSPNVHDLSALGPRPGNRWQEPADGLGAEHAIGADVGVRVERARLRGEAFGFALRYDDRIDVMPTGAVRPDGRMVVQSANVGWARYVGAEAALRWQVAGGLEVEGDVSYVRGSQAHGDGEQPADRLPPLGGGATGRWRGARLAVEAGLRWAAAQRRLSERDATDPRIDPAGTPGFATAHLAATVTLGDLAAALHVANLLDRRYREHGSGVEAAGLDLGAMIRARF